MGNLDQSVRKIADIADDLRASRQSAESEKMIADLEGRRKELLLKNAPCALCRIVDLKNSVTEMVKIPPKVERIFGCLPGELDGKDVKVLIPARLHASHDSHIKRFCEHPTERRMGEGGGLTGIRRTATGEEEFPLEIELSPEYLDGELHVTLTFFPQVKH